MNSISNSKSKLNKIFDNDMLMIDDQLQMESDSEL